MGRVRDESPHFNPVPFVQNNFYLCSILKNKTGQGGYEKLSYPPAHLTCFLKFFNFFKKFKLH